jgi:hypothetical protein
MPCAARKRKRGKKKKQRGLVKSFTDGRSLALPSIIFVNVPNLRREGSRSIPFNSLRPLLGWKQK